MTDFNYKKYSLEKLEEWMHDAMSCDETTPQDIFDVIKGVVKENYYHHKYHTSRAYELLALLNGNGQSYEDVMKEKEYYEPSMPPWGHSDLEYMIHHKEPLSCGKDNTSPEYEGAWNSFWEEETPKSTVDKVVKWVLPVEVSDDNEEDYVINLPDDLLEQAGWKENDILEWIDNNDGTFILRKPNAV